MKEGEKEKRGKDNVGISEGKEDKNRKSNNKSVGMHKKKQKKQTAAVSLQC